VALAVALLAAWNVWAITVPVPPGRVSIHSDLHVQWAAARGFWRGVDAYSLAGPEPWRALVGNFTLTYPATTLVALAPFVGLSFNVAAALFGALSYGILAYALTASTWAGLLALLAWPCYAALRLGQWAPLLAAAALLPRLAWLVAVKPHMGAVVAVTRTDARWWRIAFAGGLGLALVAWTRDPDWLASWRLALAARPGPGAGAGTVAAVFRPLAAYPGGALALLALLRWRRPEARLLAALACVPHTTFGYELTLLCALVPQRWPEYMMLVIASWGLGITRVGLATSASLAENWAIVATWSVWWVLVPALLMVLLRPNVGQVPAWIERATARLPRWLAGTPTVNVDVRPSPSDTGAPLARRLT